MVIFWTLLDAVFDKDTGLTNMLLLGFFIVWNINTCARKDA